MNVSIVLITYNRLYYTIKTVSHLLNDQDQFDLYIWDNASADGTQEYLKDGLDDPRIKEVYLSTVNLGQTAAMNYFWKKCNTELVGKLDNDCLVSPGWIDILSRAHRDIENLGAIGCWHFRKEDFDYEKASRKIERINGHEIFRHPYVGGSGFLLKRKTFLRIGPWEEGSPDIGTTGYFLKMALSGYINGWYYPLVLQEHMDDPVSSHSVIKDDETLREMYDITYTLRTKNIRTYQDRLKRRDHVLSNLFDGPLDPKYHVGWRARLSRHFPTLYRLLISVCPKKSF